MQSIGPHLDAFRLVKMSDAFDAGLGIDLVNVLAGADRFGGTLGPASITVNAVFQDG